MKWWHFARPGVSSGGGRATEALWEKCEVVGSVLAALTYNRLLGRDVKKK